MKSVPVGNLFLATSVGLCLLVSAFLPSLAMAQVSEFPEAPVITSESYPDPTKWYSNPNGYVSWDIPAEVIRVSAEVSTTTSGEPSDTYDTTKTGLYLNSSLLQEGLQYVSVQFRNGTGWGDVAFYPIRLDITPPLPFTIKVEKGQRDYDFPTLYFETEDTLSGIEKYEVYVPHEQIINVAPENAKDGLTLSNLEDNIYIIKVAAYDKAGNKRESTISVVVNAGWTEGGGSKQTSGWMSYFADANGVILVLTLVILAQFLYILYEKQQLKIEETLIKQETKDAQDQMVRIFSALRAEIYDQINLISKKKRVTKAEQEAIDGLNDAVKVSEKLLKKELRDIKDLLK